MFGTSFAYDPQVWNSDYGEFISQSHSHMAQILHDYNPNLSLVFIPKHDRQEGETKPFAILESPPNFYPQIVRYLSEEEMKRPEEILAWVFAGDTTRQKVGDILKRAEAEDNAKKLMQLKRQEEELEDANDFALFTLTGGRNGYHTTHHNGKTYRR